MGNCNNQQELRSSDFFKWMTVQQSDVYCRSVLWVENNRASESTTDYSFMICPLLHTHHCDGLVRFRSNQIQSHCSWFHKCSLFFASHADSLNKKKVVLPFAGRVGKVFVKVFTDCFESSAVYKFLDLDPSLPPHFLLMCFLSGKNNH